MAKRRAATSEGSGILSSVFSFVSRELESFVTNATGGTQVEYYDDEDELEPSPPRPRKPKEHRGGPVRTRKTRKEEHVASRYRSPARSRNSGNQESKQRVRRLQADTEELSASDDSGSSVTMHHRRPVRARNGRVSDEDNHSLDIPNNQPSVQGSSRRHGDHRKASEMHKKPNSRRTRAVSPPAEAPSQIPSDHSSSSSPSPSPPPLPRALKRRPSISMPGSLFPRSPSLVPDPVRHVRFEPGIVSPLPTRFSPPPQPREDLGPSRRGSVVKSAVERFHVGESDANPSILLPSPNVSPARPKKIIRQEDDHSRIPARDKGKWRETSDIPEVDALDGDTSGEIRVRGKERELVAAREEQRRRERRREEGQDIDEEVDHEKAVDKERIKMLEDEIRWLKEELSKRPAHYTPSHTSIPPPPPPPPPPPMTGGSVRIPTTDFASARAALKHAPPPVEAPINPPLPSRRQGQPAIGIPPDKMAAFLTEMKTVRLKKVSEPPSGPSSSSIVRRDSMNQGSMSLVASLRRVGDSSFSARRNSFERDDSSLSMRVGDKRKRNSNELSEYQDDLRVAVKRRSLASSDSSFASTSSSSFLFSQSYPPPSRLAIPVPARATASGTDATTPSLCSDNGADLDDRPPSTPPILPSRNIYRFKGTGIPVNTPVPDAYEKELEIIDVDMLEDDTPINQSYTTTDVMARRSMMPPPPPKSPRSRAQNADLFAKRPPKSPLPAPSPRKPRPPARTRPLPPTPPRRRPQPLDGEDPLLLTFSPEQPRSRIPRRRAEARTSLEQESSTSAHPENSEAGTSKLESRSDNKGKKTRRSAGRSEKSADSQRAETAPSPIRPSPSISSGSGRTRRNSARRLTLDEEMRDARTEENQDYGDDDGDDEDNGVLIGVGTRSKKLGFLARGGAGGSPVFMGVGYVEGAEEALEEEDEPSSESDGDDEYLPEPRKRGTSSSTTGQRRSRQ